MKLDKLSLRIGAAVVAVAVVLRLLSAGVLQNMFSFLLSPQTTRVLLFLETGRWARLPVQEAEPVLPDRDPVSLAAEPAAFTKEDARLVAVNSYCGYEAEPEALLQMPLDWDLTEGGPKVLILHSHGSESYTKTENYKETSKYRTLDTQYNMVSVGDRLAQLLEDGGVEVIHDRTVHDYPSYTDAYSQSRKSVQSYLKKYPDICLVLDLHRDALQDSKGNQVGYTVTLGREKAARVMLVVGTDAGGFLFPAPRSAAAETAKRHKRTACR